MMFKSLLTAAAAASPVLAHTFGGLNLYWGQYGPPDDRLAGYCDSPGVSSVTLAFVNKSPRNGKGFPGTNFAGHCGGEVFYKNPVTGEDTALIMNCDLIKQDIKYCQSLGKKVLLSVGGHCPVGGPCDYDIATEIEGKKFAKQLHKIFGPYEDDYNGPRPFDISEDERNAVDGFDFDIEFKYADQRPWIKMVETLRSLNSNYIITAAPQCPTSDEWFQLKELVYGAKFDALFVQFYNNPGCQVSDDFNYGDWVRVLSETSQSKDAKIYVGLLASEVAGWSGYADNTRVKDVVCQLKDSRSFGGLSIWDATRGAANVISDKNFNVHAADALKYGCGAVPPPPATTTTVTTSTSSDLASSSAVSASVSSEISSAIDVSISASSSAISTGVSSVASSTIDGSVSVSSSAFSTVVSPSFSSVFWPNITTSAVQSSTITSLSSFPSTGSSVIPTTTAVDEENQDDDADDEENQDDDADDEEDGPSPSGSSSFTKNPIITKPTKPTKPSVTTTAPEELTTSTVYTTATRTVTSCPPNTPCTKGEVVTETIPWYTTVCPVSTTKEAPKPTITSTPAWTTSTVYSTKTYTLTSCPPDVPYCPNGQVTTEVTWYTTVCPITSTDDAPEQPTSVPEHPVKKPAPSGKPSHVPEAPADEPSASGKPTHTTETPGDKPGPSDKPAPPQESNEVPSPKDDEVPWSTTHATTYVYTTVTVPNAGASSVPVAPPHHNATLPGTGQVPKPTSVAHEEPEEVDEGYEKPSPAPSHPVIAGAARAGMTGAAGFFAVAVAAALFM